MYLTHRFVSHLTKVGMEELNIKIYMISNVQALATQVDRWPDNQTNKNASDSYTTNMDHNWRYYLHLGFVHPLQDVALHQCLPSLSVCCFPNPGGSLLLCLCHLAIFCLVVLSTSSLSLAATLCIALSTYCPLILLYDRLISTFVSVCILWYWWSLFFFWFPSMVSYLLALGLTFSFPLLSERFSVCLSVVYLETMFGSHRSWLARYIGPLLVF